MLNDTDKLLDHAQISLDDGCVGNPENCNYNNNGPQGHNLDQHRPLIRYFLRRNKSVPEGWVLEVEDFLVNFYNLMHSLGSRKNIGRTFIGLLMILAVISVFLKFSILDALMQVDGKPFSKENDFPFIQNINSNLARAQNVMVESMESSSDAVLHIRQMTEYPVSLAT